MDFDVLSGGKRGDRRNATEGGKADAQSPSIPDGHWRNVDEVPFDKRESYADRIQGDLETARG